MNFINHLKNFIINSLYPRHLKCIACKGEILNKNVYDLCPKCYKYLPFIKYNFCVRCGLPMPNEGSGTCLNCKRKNFDFEFARSVFSFDDEIINIIHRFKYAKHKFLAQPLSYLLYDKLLVEDWKIDLIAYAPLHPNREKSRGYNQSRELASELSKLSNIPMFNDIIRIKDTPSQTSLTRIQREENVKDCFKINSPSNIKDLNILIVDDVFTTGSTTNEIAKLLKHHHANKVYVLTVAHAGFEQKF